MSALAHHSISAAYDSSKEVSLEGVVTQFHFVHPHPFLDIEVKQGDSTTQWMLEMDSRGELARAGMSSETFKHGDSIVVQGSPARDGRQSLYIRRLERRADGFQLEQVRRSPRIRFAQ
jgi:hypothetical protein